MKDTINGVLSLKLRLASGEIATIERAASITGYGLQHMRRLCQSGRIEAIKIGKRYYIPATVLAALIRPAKLR